MNRFYQVLVVLLLTTFSFSSFAQIYHYDPSSNIDLSQGVYPLILGDEIQAFISTEDDEITIIPADNDFAVSSRQPFLKYEGMGFYMNNSDFGGGDEYNGLPLTLGYKRGKYYISFEFKYNNVWMGGWLRILADEEGGIELDSYAWREATDPSQWSKPYDRPILMGEGTTSPKSNMPSAVTIIPPSNNITVATYEGAYVDLDLTFQGGDVVPPKTNWTSSNEAIAHFDSAFPGRLFVDQEGTVEVSVTTSNGLSNTISLSIVLLDPPSFDFAYISTESDDIERPDRVSEDGATQQLYLFIYPRTYPSRKALWSVDDSSIAEIDQKGLLTAKSNGTVTVTAIAINGEEITQEIDISRQGFAPNNLSVNSRSGVWFIQYGREYIDYAGGTLELFCDSDNGELPVTWTIDNPAIASIDANGILTAKSNGTINVTATSVKYPSLTSTKAFQITHQEYEDQFKVMTYNILNLVDDDTAHFERLKHVVTNYQPDILFTQENDIKWFAEGLQEALGTDYYLSWELNEEQCHNGYNGKGIITRFPIVETNKYQLPGHVTTEVKVEYQLGKFMYLVNIHQVNQRGYVHGQLAQMKAWSYEMQDRWRNFPTIIAGDFNNDGPRNNPQFYNALNILVDMGFKQGNYSRIIKGTGYDGGTIDHIYINDAFTYNFEETSTWPSVGVSDHEAEVSLLQLNDDEYKAKYQAIRKVLNTASLNFSSNDFQSVYSGDATIKKITIVQLPEKGQLSLNGSPVVEDQEIMFSQIGGLQYLANAGAVGRDEIMWQADDGILSAQYPIYIEMPSSIIDSIYTVWGGYADVTKAELSSNPYLAKAGRSIVQLPAYLNDAEMLRAPERITLGGVGSKNHYWGVKVNQPVTVYVAVCYYGVDDYPEWFQPFQNPKWVIDEFELVEENAMIVSDEGVNKKFHIFKKDFPKGDINLGFFGLPYNGQKLTADDLDVIPMIVPRKVNDYKIEVKKGLNYSFNSTNISALDFDGALSTISFSQLPREGALLLNDAAITAGQQIAISDFDALQFIAGANLNFESISFNAYNDQGKLLDSASLTIHTYNIIKNLIHNHGGKYKVGLTSNGGPINLAQEVQELWDVPEFLIGTEIILDNASYHGVDHRDSLIIFTLDEDKDVFVLHDSKLDKPDWLTQDYQNLNASFSGYDVFKKAGVKGEQLLFRENIRPDLDRSIEQCFYHYRILVSSDGALIPTQVKFQVDFQEVENLDPKGPHIAGQFNDWVAEPMTHEGNNIYSYTYNFTPNQSGTVLEYKFLNGKTNWEATAGLLDCSKGESNNRFFTVPESNADLPIVCYDLCVACQPNNTFTINGQLAQLKIQPNPTSEYLQINLQSKQPVSGFIELYDVVGNRLLSNSKRLNTTQNLSIDVSAFAPGIYFLTFLSSDGVITVSERVVVSR